MDSETIEHFLSNYFNEIRWVNTDVVVDEITTVYKENGIVKSKNTKQTFNMLSLLTPSLEEVNRLLHLQIDQCQKNIINVSFIDRLLKKNIFKDIEGDWIITSSDIFKQYFSHRENINVYIADNFKDLVVVGNKDISILLHESLESFHIDCNNLKVYQIKKSR